MTLRVLDVRGRKVAIAEAGQGRPVVYLHGFADVHAVAADFQPFHQALAEKFHLIAPAHPGLNGSDELSDGWSINDIAFHYLEVFDALGLEQFDLIGHCVGGWIAAELAVRHPERIRSLTLIGACGLFVAGQPTADIFMHAQPERGVDYATLRNLLFSGPNSAAALRWYPNGRGDLDEETRRYQMLRFGSFVGFRPPYFYDRALVDRLHRARMPSLVLWGESDHMVPSTHGAAYANGLPVCSGVKIIPGAGHAIPLEFPAPTANECISFLARPS